MFLTNYRCQHPSDRPDLNVSHRFHRVAVTCSIKTGIDGEKWIQQQQWFLLNQPSTSLHFRLQFPSVNPRAVKIHRSVLFWKVSYITRLLSWERKFVSSEQLLHVWDEWRRELQCFREMFLCFRINKMTTTTKTFKHEHTGRPPSLSRCLKNNRHSWMIDVKHRDRVKTYRGDNEQLVQHDDQCVWFL